MEQGACGVGSGYWDAPQRLLRTQHICHALVPSRRSSRGSSLANEAMDLGDRHFGLAHLGRIETSSRGDLAHGWHKR